MTFELSISPLCETALRNALPAIINNYKSTGVVEWMGSGWVSGPMASTSMNLANANAYANAYVRKRKNRRGERGKEKGKRLRKGFHT